MKPVRWSPHYITQSRYQFKYENSQIAIIKEGNIKHE